MLAQSNEVISLPEYCNTDPKSSRKAVRVVSSKGEFYKKNETDKVWWYEKFDATGEHLFSFDKNKLFNLFTDYPWKLSVTEWLTFNKENEFWYNFFEDRNFKYKKEHQKEIEERLLEEALGQ